MEDKPNQSSYQYCVKLLMLGDSGVGKTSLVSRFYFSSWQPETISTIGLDFKIKSVVLDDQTVLKMLVWDTSGQEKYMAVAKNYYQNDDASKPPIGSWRSHGSLLYTNWLNYYVYQMTPYQLDASNMRAIHPDTVL